MLSIGTVQANGGGRIGICAIPGSSGRLESDLTLLLAWQPSIVLSMTENHEMAACGCLDLGARLEASEIAWFHLPIGDFGAPDPKTAATWKTISPRLHDNLDTGAGVLLHCRGGKGRSGMIALRLLVERGEGPKEALDRLRLARPGAVETQQQLEWASNI